mmetsp:Transcript_26172/g.86081  ORF Transcript_26172/g.86081 Transcript_26172/m.86081 type:complete len:105 (-) Transcript_26172:452-766(-)
MKDEQTEGEAEPTKVMVRNGVGIYKLDGNIYEGEWVADKMHGHGENRGKSIAVLRNVCAGVFKFMDGSKYDGDWVDNEFHGQGKYQWSTGAYYMGAWEKNRFDS